MSGPHPDPLADMLSKPHELDGRFEPEAKTVTTGISDAALISIAVSLKRIADALDGGDSSQGIQNTLFFLERRVDGAVYPACDEARRAQTQSATKTEI